MYIGNIHWKHCRLETSFAFCNKKCILETGDRPYLGGFLLDFFQNEDFFGGKFLKKATLETSLSFGNTHILETYNET